MRRGRESAWGGTGDLSGRLNILGVAASNDLEIDDMSSTDITGHWLYGFAVTNMLGYLLGKRSSTWSPDEDLQAAGFSSCRALPPFSRPAGPLEKSLEGLGQW